MQAHVLFVLTIEMRCEEILGAGIPRARLQHAKHLAPVIVELVLLEKGSNRLK